MNPSDVSKKLFIIANEGLEKQSKDRVILSLNEIKNSISPYGGTLASPIDQVIFHLNKWLTAKYTIDAAYRSYADRVRGPWRDALVKHWYDHAKEERDQGYDIAMKVVALGGDPVQSIIEVPLTTPSLKTFCAKLLELEMKAIDNGLTAIKMAGDNAPIRLLAEQIIYTDSQHIDDLVRMCSDFET